MIKRWVNKYVIRKVDDKQVKTTNEYFPVVCEGQCYVVPMSYRKWEIFFTLLAPPENDKVDDDSAIMAKCTREALEKVLKRIQKKDGKRYFLLQSGLVLDFKLFWTRPTNSNLSITFQGVFL
ncbi:hypothetical protein Syun_029149 [Stephania yunnanensis]|uniref:Uncharacterized protein n=1 Tax=Stephania yunnanensis TaxID=152371 RepID=A0AAP0E4U9_9MAGN